MDHCSISFDTLLKRKKNKPTKTLRTFDYSIIIGWEEYRRPLLEKKTRSFFLNKKLYYPSMFFLFALDWRAVVGKVWVMALQVVQWEWLWPLTYNLEVTQGSSTPLRSSLWHPLFVFSLAVNIHWEYQVLVLVCIGLQT